MICSWSQCVSTGNEHLNVYIELFGPRVRHVMMFLDIGPREVELILEGLYLGHVVQIGEFILEFMLKFGKVLFDQGFLGYHPLYFVTCR